VCRQSKGQQQPKQIAKLRTGYEDIVHHAMHHSGCQGAGNADAHYARQRVRALDETDADSEEPPHGGEEDDESYDSGFGQGLQIYIVRVYVSEPGDKLRDANPECAESDSQDRVLKEIHSRHAPYGQTRHLCELINSLEALTTTGG